jgi:type I restriction enzyme S subunit
MSAQIKVPKLRFSEFNGEWEEKKLGEVAEKIGDGLHGTSLYSDDSDIYFINGNNLTNGKIEINENTKKVDHEIFKKNDKSLNNNTLLISLNGTIGNIAKYNNEKIMLSKSVGYFNFKENTDFYYHVLNTKTIQNFFISELTGSTIKNLSLKTLRETEISFPSLPEQQKIATFLTAIDTKIDQLTKKQTLLKQYKKGVMQKLFSQELRFKADDGSEFSDWEEKTLGKVCDCLDNIRKPLNDEERQKVQGSIPYWGANNIMGYINDYLFDETIVLLAEDGGNFNEYKTRPIANISHGKCWVNNHTHVLRGKINILINEFLYYSVVHKNITGYVSGGTRAKLTKGEMLKIEIALPTLKEQFKISNFLTSIDTKIDLATKQLDSTKQYKKALLQQMFV